MAEQQTAEPAVDEAGAKKSGGMLGKLMVAGFMAGVVGIECAVAYFLIPSPEQVVDMAERRLQDRLPDALNTEDGDGEGESKPTVEKELGEYSVTVRQPNSSTSLRVDFTLFGTVAEENDAEFTELYDRHVQRFRDQIVYEIRNSEPADLEDPALGLIKRRILEKSTELLGEPLLEAVFIPDFSYIEQ